MHRSSTALVSVVAISLIASTSVAPGRPRAMSDNAAPKPLAVGDPAKVLYFVPGVVDSGPDNTGVATSFHCSSFSAVTERLSFVVRDWNGAVKANKTFDLASLRTMTASTHGTSQFSDDLNLTAGEVAQGIAVIRSTSVNVVCSAMMMDASSSAAQGIALHMIRSNPMTGTQE